MNTCIAEMKNALFFFFLYLACQVLLLLFNLFYKKLIVFVALIMSENRLLLEDIN